MRARVLIWLCLSLLPLELAAGPAEDRGLAIAVEADRRDAGWRDQQSQVTMVLGNRHGQQTTRRVLTRTLEVADDGDKSLSVFHDPADVKGTSFLTFTHATRPDDQWLYLPALKRVKRIASANKSGPFVGSEFAYEDLTSQEVAKYTYKYLRDEDVGGKPSFVLERYPAYAHSGYTRQVVWMDRQMYQPWKIEFYDRKGELLKTLVYADYRQYLGRYWRSHRMEMVNHQTAKTTTLDWETYSFQNGFNERDFDHTSLARAH